MMENKIKNLLKNEVAHKGQASTYFFAFFAIFSFFYGYSISKYLWIIKITSVISLISTIIRNRLSNRIIKQKTINQKEWICLKSLIWINGICWGIILNTASFELQLTGIHFIVVTTLLAGLVGASIVTISYFTELFIPFQVAILLPQIIIIVYYYYFNSQHLNNLPLIVLYILYFLYQLKAFKTYRFELVKLFKYQITLENKNKKLKESQEALLNQSILLAHTSRLGAIGEMSATIAHEINNPIAVVSASSKMIIRESAKNDINRDVLNLNTDRINRSVSRIVNIVKGLRNLSHQSDHLPKVDFSLNEIIEDTGFFCSELLISQNIKLIIDTVPEASIFCHPVQISQVLINLIKNASEVITEELPEIEKWIRIQFLLDQDLIKIFVSNGGPKIKSEICAKIFEPFFTTKKVGIGTGIGLSISKKIVIDHQGKIFIDLNLENTTFVLEFKNSIINTQVSQ